MINLFPHTFFVALVLYLSIAFIMLYLLLSYLIHLQKKRRVIFPVVYTKQLPFHLDERGLRKLRNIGEFIGIILLTSFIAFTIIDNLAPFGITVHYNSSTSSDTISAIGPKNRVQVEEMDGQQVIRQIHDLVYFSTKLPFYFDRATVRLTFKNPDPDQTIALGFQDQPTWHYDTQPFDVPFLNNITWNHIGKQPVLYQKEKHFSSLSDFFKHTPQDAIIGTYDTQSQIGDVSHTQLSDYAPQSTDTVIDTPLRGRHIVYMYLKNEPFHMTIWKQDLNWYEDPDIMTVKIYKGQELVYQTNVDDDGITDASKKILPPQKVDINKSAKGIPESGVYKVVIDASGDTIIRRIQTNLHKIVFQGSIFPVANSTVYSPLVASTSATIVYSNALTLGALTYHPTSLQNISVGQQTLAINMLKTEKIIVPKENFTAVTIPKNDVILNAYQGFISFSPEQFFLPTPYHILPITTKDDINLTDYILTDYTPSQKIGDWQVAEHTFDLRSAYLRNGLLSWTIQAPKLKDSNRSIIIKNIDIIFHKDALF